MSRWRRDSEPVGMEWGSTLEVGFSRWEADCGGGAGLVLFVMERNRLWWGWGGNVGGSKAKREGKAREYLS